MIITISGWPQKLNLIAHSDIPKALQSRYSKREAVLQTTEDFEVCWEAPNKRIALCKVESGLIFDGSSIPWAGRIIGLSRWSPDLWQICGAITHDPAYQGAMRFPDDVSERRNRLYHDRLARDLWRWAGGSWLQVRKKYIGLRLAGWSAYESVQPYEEHINKAYIRWTGEQK